MWIYSVTDLPFAAYDELFQFVRTQDYAAHVHVLLRQPFVFHTFFGRESFPGKPSETIIKLIARRPSLFLPTHHALKITMIYHRYKYALGICQNMIFWYGQKRDTHLVIRVDSRKPEGFRVLGTLGKTMD